MSKHGRSPRVLRVLAILAAVLAVGVFAEPAFAERARDLGIPLDGTPGPLNAITDVAGVEVGQVTLIEGSGRLRRGRGPVRTGVTAILPRGRNSTSPVFAAWDTINAAGEMTGTVWLDERGFLDGPIMITNTHSVGVVRDAVVDWLVTHNWPGNWFTPLVAETFDGQLNDTNGFHVRREHALRAIETASSGPVAEGNVGGGTGMICSQFKGGIGTASRVVDTGAGIYTVGVLVQCNYGRRDRFRVAGAPVGAELRDRYMPCTAVSPTGPCETTAPPVAPPPVTPHAEQAQSTRDGSIIVVIATDAPLLPHQLRRIAKRPALAIGRLGDISSESSGDIFVAFSTANTGLQSREEHVVSIDAFPNTKLTEMFTATVQATEEAVLNAMLAAETMTGRDNHRVFALPHEELRTILRHYNRLNQSQ